MAEDNEEIDEEEEKEYSIEDAEANFDNEEFMLKALQEKAWWVVAYSSDRLKANKEFMMKAVQSNGQLLYYASKELRDDKDIVSEAVKNKWLIFKYASKRLRGDKDVAKIALEQNLKASIYLTDEIKKDPEIDAILHPKGRKRKRLGIFYNRFLLCVLMKMCKKINPDVGFKIWSR